MFHPTIEKKESITFTTFSQQIIIGGTYDLL